ncbi:Caleosin related protein-domain-containing protein [Catenaria anguillulae PL171]|uniref:Caleosin related protein-domain-containing protein n=1 Tax=Catenaria anguillulae PL171 TaxID=765915 RepID=A0A1Y2HVB2_9FUNG|nr:Caleosin related protein-domain-containing protein [Catenaria anguillulae PL171]
MSTTAFNINPDTSATDTHNRSASGRSSTHDSGHGDIDLSTRVSHDDVTVAAAKEAARRGATYTQLGQDAKRIALALRTSGHPDPALATDTDTAPVTVDRPTVMQLDTQRLPAPWMPRATRAIDLDHPNGTTGNYPFNHMSVLQQHVKFFDLNDDGLISPVETYQAFRSLGFNIFISLLAVVFINGTMSYSTSPSWVPDPLLRVNITNIHRVKHGSDSGIIDTEGRFIPAKFEELFAKYSYTRPGFLTWREAFAMTEALRNAMDPYGWAAAKLEWGVFFLLCGRRDHELGELVVAKELVRSQYDGTLFYRIRAERQAALARGQEYLSSVMGARDLQAVELPEGVSAAGKEE